jgi:hypothetical protein
MVAIPSAARPPQVDREHADVLREHRPAFVEEDEQVGGAVIIAVDDRSNVLVSRRVELFDQINPVVEIPVRFTPDELSVVVILLDVRAAVEIRVDSYFGGLAWLVVVLPDVRSAVAIAVFREDDAASTLKSSRDWGLAGLRAKGLGLRAQGLRDSGLALFAWLESARQPTWREALE